MLPHGVEHHAERVADSQREWIQLLGSPHQTLADDPLQVRRQVEVEARDRFRLSML